MKYDVLVHSLMVALTALILVFNFHNVFGNLEASFIGATWAVFTSHRVSSKKIDQLHETIKENKKNDD